MKICPSCKREFEPENKRQTYCSVHCRTYKYHKVCEICGKEFLAENLKTKLCSRECMSKSRKQQMPNILNRMQETCIEKYGVSNVMKLDEKKEKLKETNLKKYGVENPLSNKEVQNKVRQTNLERYGVENVALNKDILKKRFQTNLKRYGSISPFGSKQIQKKIEQNNLKTLGYKHWKQTPEGQEWCKDNNPFRYRDVLEKAKRTNIERYGVPYYVMTKDYKIKGKVISNLNKKIGDLFNITEDDYEISIGKYSYDLRKDNILIEINPTVSHNVIYSYAYFIGVTDKNKPISVNYHINKTNVANKNNYKCIHIWDWDNLDKIKYMLQDKETLYARNLIIKDVNKKECNEFLNENHLQNTCKGQTIRLGLYKDNELIQVMTFGKPRYNKNYEYELLRLCTHRSYKVVGGSERLFKYFLREYKPGSIISYCDNSKFSGDVYKKLEFNLKSSGKPSAHWYNLKTGRHITNNLLLQRGFSQLHNDSDYKLANKGDSNEKLMIEAGYLKVYDCGQSVYIWNKED